MDLKKEDIAEMMGLYLNANTPEGLYATFRKAPLTKQLSQNCGANELIDFVCKIDADLSPGIEEETTAYIALVAATFHTLGDVNAALSGKQIMNLRWAKSLLLIWYSATSSNQDKVFDNSIFKNDIGQVSSNMKVTGAQPLLSGVSNNISRIIIP